MKENTHNADTPFHKKYASSRSKREKKSRVPSAQECQESPEECVRARGLGALRGLRAPPAHLEPKAGSSTSSCATAAPGQPQRKRRRTPGVCSPGSSLSARPLSSPGRGQPRSARQRSPEERPGEGLPRHGRRSASPPRVTRRSCGESRRALASRPGGPGAPGLWKGVCLTEPRKAATQGASAPGATATAAGGSACGTARRRLPCPPRHSPVPARPRPSRQGKAGDTVPPSVPRSPAAVLLTRPEPPLSRRGIPANSAPLSARPASRTRRRSRARTARPLERGRGRRGRAGAGRAGEEPGGGAPAGEPSASRRFPARLRPLVSLRERAARPEPPYRHLQPQTEGRAPCSSSVRAAVSPAGTEQGGHIGSLKKKLSPGPGFCRLEAA